MGKSDDALPSKALRHLGHLVLCGSGASGFGSLGGRQVNAHAINRDQKNARHRAGQPVGACDAHVPAHGERGVEYRSPDCFDAVTSINWPGAVATVARPFSHTCVARASLSVEPRRRVQGFSLPLAHGSVATFNSCAALLIGRSHQLNRIAHKLGGNRPNPLHRHSFALSHEQTCRAKELEPCSLIQGKRLPQ